MDRKKPPRNPMQLFLGCTGLFALAAYVNIFPPDSAVTVVTFFILLVVTLVLLGLYVFRRYRIALVVALAVAVYLMLRLLGLRHPLYALLLAASVFAIEYLFRQPQR